MEKAVIQSYDLVKKMQGSDSIRVHFNPASYTITTSANYDTDSQSINNNNKKPNMAFIKSNSSVFSTELVFDTYDHSKPAIEQRDVRDDFKLLQSLLRVDPALHVPDGVRFSWGTLVFIGAITELKASYTMFSDTGTPVRAKLSISITGYSQEEWDGAFNESPDRTKLRVINQGETLWDLAEREYGSGGQWRVIALANGIENPRKVSGGTKLLLPALPGGEA